MSSQIQQWVDALRSGEYEQTTGYLCKGNRYCCLGVAAEAVLGREFEALDDTASYYSINGQTGFTLLLDKDKATLELDKELTVSELLNMFQVASWNYFEVDIIEAPTDRQSALTYMNDHGCDFETIAQFLESLEWEV